LATETEALYVLPPELIAAIDDQIPDFLRPEDLAFERALAASEDVGFFRQRPVVFPLVPWAGRLGLGDQDWERRVDRTSAEIDELMGAERSQAGLTEVEIERIEQKNAEVRRQIQLRQQGYLAWLATDSAFRGELDQVRRVWDQEHGPTLDLPRLSLEFLGQRRTRPAPEQGGSEAMADRFLWKWGLERLEAVSKAVAL
jgi:hypothetical protein